MCYSACDHEEIPKSAVLQIIGPCKILNYIFMHLRLPRVTDPRLNGTDRCGADQKPLANEDDIYDSQIFSAIFQILFTQMILFHRRKERTLSYAIFMKIIISFSYITCIFFNSQIHVYLFRHTSPSMFIFHFTFLTIGPSQPIRIISGVAGHSSWQLSESPWSFLAALTASLRARCTLAANRRGGSPIPCTKKCKYVSNCVFEAKINSIHLFDD